MVLTNDVDKCGANGVWPLPTATDDCSNNITVAQTGGPALGDLIPVGPAVTITYTATDDSGNTDECSFEVSVMDMQLPTISCPSGIQNIGTSAGLCEAVISGTALNKSSTNSCQRSA